MTALTVTPSELGSAGAYLALDGAAGKPTLRDLLEEHRLAIESLRSGQEGEVILARFATTTNDSLSGLAARDGVTPVAGDIALVKDHATGSSKGLYVAASGTWTRLKDATGADVIKSGMLVQVSEGTVNADTQWQLATNAPITVGTTSLSFTQVEAGAATPQPVGPAAAVGTSLKWSREDHAHDDVQTAAAGTALTDADETVVVGDGLWRKIPTLSGNRTKTIGTTGAVARQQLTITRTSTAANTVDIVNGGGGGGTLVQLPASKQAFVKLQYDGTDWSIRELGIGP